MSIRAGNPYYYSVFIDPRDLHFVLRRKCGNMGKPRVYFPPFMVLDRNQNSSSYAFSQRCQLF